MKKILSFILSFIVVAAVTTNAQWTVQTSGTTARLQTVKIVDANIIWAAGNTGVVLKSVDGGKTWVKKALVDSVGTARVNGIEAFDSVTAWAACVTTGSLGVTVYKTTNGGTSWVKQFNFPTASFADGLRMFDANNGVLVSDPAGFWHIITTSNGGTTWTRVDSAKIPYDPVTVQEVGVTGCIDIKGSKVWFGTYNGNTSYNARVYRSTDKGATWSVSNQIAGMLSIYGLSFKDDLNGIAVAYEGPVGKTTDGGVTWTVLSKSPGINLRCVKAIPGTNNVLVVGASGVTYLSSDFGENWTTITPANTNTFRGLDANKYGIWGVGDNGNIVMWSGATLPVELTSFNAVQNGSNVKLSWSTATETNNKGFEVERKLIVNGASNGFITVAFKAGAGTTSEVKNYSLTDNLSGLNAAAVAYRIKQVDYDGTFSYSKEVVVNLTTPETFSLQQNYPNPFNPSTTIKYSVPSASKVSLKVFDVLGKEVAVLVNETKTAGNYEVNFDASKLTSGVYFYQLQAGSSSVTKKLTLMK